MHFIKIPSTKNVPSQVNRAKVGYCITLAAQFPIPYFDDCFCLFCDFFHDINSRWASRHDEFVVVKRLQTSIIIEMDFSAFEEFRSVDV